MAVEIDLEDNEVLELVLLLKFAEDRILRLAGRAPRRMDRNQDRLAGRLRRGKRLGIVIVLAACAVNEMKLMKRVAAAIEINFFSMVNSAVSNGIDY